VTVVGSVNLDLVATVARLPGAGETIGDARLDRVPGGKGANQALAAARLGADVRLIAAVGRDATADLALLLLAAGGVDLGAVRRTDESTGIALITVDEQGETTIVVVPGANATLQLMAADDLAASDAVICQLETPMETVAAAAEATSGFFCLNPAPAAPVPESVLARADLIVANRHEYAAIPGLDAARLVAVTHGAAGAELRQGGVRIGYAKAPEVVAIDGTGAGDGFVAALVVGLLEKREPQDALRRACIAGALAASRAGAQPSLPTRAELDRLSDRMAADPADPLATDMTPGPT